MDYDKGRHSDTQITTFIQCLGDLMKDMRIMKKKKNPNFGLCLKNSQLNGS